MTDQINRMKAFPSGTRAGAIITCFDGHSEWLTWDAYNAEKDLSPGRFWCNPSSTNGH